MKMPRDIFDLAKEWKGHTSLNIDRIGLSPLANKEFRTDWTILISQLMYVLETALSRIKQTPILAYDITTITVHYMILL